MDTRRIQSLVEDLLAREGTFRPVDFLLKTGRLPASGLDAWRKGNPAWLDEALAGNPERIEQWLEIAHQWARKIDLEQHPASPPGSKGGFSRKPGRDRLLRTEWQKRTESDQLDLFFDNQPSTVLGELKKALADARIEDAELLLEKLYQLSPRHSRLNDAEALLDAARLPTQAMDDPAGVLARVEALEPLARDFFGDTAQAYLHPLWTCLAEALDAGRFDPELPQLHPSLAWSRIGRWDRVVESIVNLSDHASHPVLVERLIRARLNLDRWQAALPVLFGFCRDFPDDALDFLDRADHPVLRNECDAFFDADEDPDPAWFPAFMLAGNPAVAREDWNGLSGDKRPATRACLVLSELARNPECTERALELARLNPMVHARWKARA